MRGMTIKQMNTAENKRLRDERLFKKAFIQGVRAGWRQSGEGWNAEICDKKEEATVVNRCLGEL